MKAIKIVVDGVFFQIGRSGIARVWTKILQHWVSTHVADNVVVIDRGRSMPRLPGITYVDAPAFHYGDLEGDRRMIQAICDQAGADVFISTYYTFPVSTPSLMMVHDMIPEVLHWDLSEPMWRQKQQALAYASAFVTVSHNTARDLSRHLGHVDRPVDVTPNGCDFAPASEEAVQAFRSKLGLDKPYFLLSGTRSDYKNAQLFFNAFALLGEQRADYAVLCTGGGELEAEFKALAGPAEVRVVILSDHDMVCAYSGAVALAYPSAYEGFGLPVLEAMACGCPVISTDVASLPEVGGDAPLYVQLGPHAAQQMLDHLHTVQDPACRHAMIQRGLEQARHFQWRSMADGVARALSRLAKRTPSAPLPARLQSNDQLLPHRGYQLALPADHLLPHYQREHRLYDRFLPILARALPAGSAAIDVGANCGDTLAAMFDANPNLTYVCVEPDSAFYRYLCHNSQHIRQAHAQADIHLVQALVGKQVTEAVLAGGGGSKHAQALPASGQTGSSGEVHRSVTLDSIVEQTLNPRGQTVRLLKSDVDGYDHDVLASANHVLATQSPMLFFECLASNHDQLNAYKASLSGLYEQGYRHFWVFDNYGNPMFCAGEPSQVTQVFDYIWRQANHAVTRSMYYVDILAVVPQDKLLADQVVAQYVSAYCA